MVMPLKLKTKNSNTEKIILGIDASNISFGGGFTHLSQILTHINLKKFKIEKVIVWSKQSTIYKLPKNNLIEYRSPFWINLPFAIRFIFQQIWLPFVLKISKCNILFSPGGIIPICYPFPTVSISQNMLPFDSNQSKLFGLLSFMRLKMFILYIMQLLSFKFSNGIIFLSNYAKENIPYNHNSLTKVIPHGIECRFKAVNRKQRNYDKLNKAEPIKILYVSELMPYKHQIEIVNAVYDLKCNGWHIELILVGKSFGKYGKKVESLVKKIDPKSFFLLYLGYVRFDDIHRIYNKADIFLFASTCENLPNILLEAMSAGLPVVSSSSRPMTDILGDSAIYFDSTSIDSIKNAIIKMILNKKLRSKMSIENKKKSLDYSWKKCSFDTFKFIENVWIKNNRN